MSGSPRIAVDLLGGDDAPAVVVDGAVRAARADRDLHLMLVGPKAATDAVIGALDPHDRGRVAVATADDGVAMTDPVARGADARTTIGAALSALAAGRVDAVVSAGASGATVAASVMAVGRLHGVRRPALAAILPGVHGPLVLLDVGAGMQVNPVDLVQHAALGAGYARLGAGVAHPRVGLLSVGSEPGKGDRLRRAADAALRVHPLGAASYVGPVEGHDVVLGRRADVVVTDGFTGNVLLKGIEAALAAAPGAYPPTAVPRAAVLLGVAGTVVVCHGAAHGADLASGIALAAGLVRTQVVSHLGDAVGLGTGGTRARHEDDQTAVASSGTGQAGHHSDHLAAGGTRPGQDRHEVDPPGGRDSSPAGPAQPANVTEVSR
ncbi:MAG TPA: phosphate acyltransferase PlsX [Micromonosporaceae bacterium]